MSPVSGIPDWGWTDTELTHTTVCSYDEGAWRRLDPDWGRYESQGPLGACASTSISCNQKVN